MTHDDKHEAPAGFDPGPGHPVTGATHSSSNFNTDQHHTRKERLAADAALEPELAYAREDELKKAALKEHKAEAHEAKVHEEKVEAKAEKAEEKHEHEVKAEEKKA